MTPALTDALPQGSGRERILLAALDEFAARGFEGASTTVIAQRSGVTQPLIHYHFRNKQGLWHAAVDHVFDLLGREFLDLLSAQADRQGDARTALHALLRGTVRFCGRYPQLPRLLYLELPLATPRSAWLMDAHVMPAIARMNTLHTEHARALRLADVPPGHVIASIIGAAVTPFALGNFMTGAWGLDPADDAMIERHAEWLVTLLERGVFAPRRAALAEAT